MITCRNKIPPSFCHIFLFLFFTFITFQGNAGIRYVRNFDYIKPKSDQYTNQTIPLKIQRASSTKGEIVLIYDENLPDSIKTAINVAKELWETKLTTVVPICIEVYFEPLDSETALTTETGMWENRGILYPTAINQQWRIESDLDAESADGYICFNSEINWNCSFSTDNENSYNITTMALRGIARCLGFVSEIEKLGFNSYGFFNMQPTVYDQHLYNGYTNLLSCSRGSKELSDFVTSDNVVYDTGLGKYPVYAPSKYVQGESLCYLKNDGSLMSQSLGMGNVFMNIDDQTVDILNSIGWNIPYEELKIECLDIEEVGIGSSYKSHTFALSDNDLTIDKIHWSFSLKDLNGKYKIITESDTDTFIVDKISDTSRYHTNSDGDLEGKIECVCYVGGNKITARPYYISLEQKPQIIWVSDITFNRDNYDFSLEFAVNYMGADRISVELEEEFNYNVRTYRFDEPYIAHITTGKMSSLYYSWVTIKVKNKYGSATQTLEFAPLYSYDKSRRPATERNKIKFNSDNGANILVFNMHGSLIFQGDKSGFDTEFLPSGIYIKLETNQNGEVSSSKITVK